MRKVILLLLAMAICVACAVPEKGGLAVHTTKAVVSDASATCVECHTSKQPGIVNMWKQSKMAANGVGCAECHTAQVDEADAQQHFNNTVISTIVSPYDCQKCHETEAEEFLGSHHAEGGRVLDSLDNVLGEVVEGYPASVSGCQQCHGSNVKVDEDGKPTADTWPNFGIGRMNPDGSEGSCSSCHSRHDFTKKQVRTPETCGRCHLGPDHPQLEVYKSSKHFIAYQANMDEMNMEADEWIAGKDYFAAPTCATCHASATKNQPATHDVAERMSWNIRAPISFKTEHYDKSRKAMTDVCAACHTPKYVKKFFQQYEAGIDLYNEKFAKPATELMDKLKEAGKIDSIAFNEKIEWEYFYLWHHEGRRARNGLAMSGPDYVQWHGFYDLAERFYIEMIPEAEHLLPGSTKEILSRREHKWFTGSMTDEDREAEKQSYIEKFYK